MAKRLIQTDNAPAPIGPYSQAVQAGGMLFVSGQIALDPATMELVEGDIETETRRVMDSLQAIVQQAGAQMTDVVKCSIFVSDMGDFARINAVYGQYFPAEPPARETVEVSGLPKGGHVEISCIVLLPS